MMNELWISIRIQCTSNANEPQLENEEEKYISAPLRQSLQEFGLFSNVFSKF